MRILYVTTISLTINTFFKHHIDMLVREGNTVDIACNFKDLPIDKSYADLGCASYQVDFSRSPLSVSNFKAYGQLKQIVKNGNYDIVHCHTPNASVITRLACRKFRKKVGLKVFYTAHGFHFYKGASKINWLIYYPIEKLCSRFTDKLVTINQEDYALAKTKFKAKEVHYVPGVGIDLSKFENVQVDRVAKRREIGVPENAFLLFSVGELNKNKNHQVIIKAIAKMNVSNIHYAIAGVGDQELHLLDLARELGVGDRLHLLGYRKDIAELNYISDLFCFPSFREGLAASLIEAMASGLPVVCSCIRGNVDLISASGGALFSPFSEEECYRALTDVVGGNTLSMADNNRVRAKDFSIARIVSEMKNIYGIASRDTDNACGV